MDLRRVDTAALSEALARALGGVADAPESGPDGAAALEAWTPVRDSVIWRFNRLFWQRVADWEAASGRRFEEALPSGQSDASRPEAVADSVADFWTLLRDLEKKGQLPPEIFALEIGVGSGQRAALWLDRFRALDEERGTSYYPRLRFLLGDYSLPTLDRAMAAVAAHRDLVSVIALDALNPLKTLSFLRYKILSIHLTNVYDNLPHDEVVRRDGRLYLVETRGYIPRDAAARVAAIAGCPVGDLSQTIEQLLRVGPEALGDRARGVEFWRAAWDALRLEERLVGLEDVSQVPLPAGARPEPSRGPPGRRARRRALSPLARRGRELRPHRAAPAPARLPAGAGHLRRRHARVPPGVPGAGKARRLGGELGQRRPAARHRRADGVRRALRAVPLSPGVADVDPLHDTA